MPCFLGCGWGLGVPRRSLTAWVQGACAEGDLGCIEELSAFFAPEGTDEDAVRDAGEEVANAVSSGEHGHGIAICGGSGHGCEELVCAVFPLDGLHVVVEGALPRGAAPPQGCFGAGASGPRSDSGARIERSGGATYERGASTARSSRDFLGMEDTPANSVRRRCVIICKIRIPGFEAWFGRFD
jgi:hypothetical protein